MIIDDEGGHGQYISHTTLTEAYCVGFMGTITAYLNVCTKLIKH
jgi:hypothetical protein